MLSGSAPTPSTVCAYCGNSGNLTKEHVIPKFLYRRFPKQKTGYNARADKFMTWEAQIGDVCVNCNNGSLSHLDGQASKLIDDLKIGRTYEKRCTVDFGYDWSVLTRWLLKVSYNSTRALNDTPLLLQQCANYICDEDAEHPPIAFLALEVVRDTPVAKERRHELPKEQRNRTHIPSRMFRIGPSILHDPESDAESADHVLRFVALNAWYFTICIVNPITDRPTRKRLRASFKKFVPDAVFLKSHESKGIVTVSRRTGADLYAFHASQVQRQWTDYAKTRFPTVLSNTR